MGRVQFKSVLCQLRLEIFASAAVLAIHGRFNNYAACVFVCCLRKFDMNIAIVAVEADLLYKRYRNVKNLEFDSSSRRIERLRIIFGPAVNRIYRNLLGSHVGNRDMFLFMAVLNILVEWIA